MEDILRPIYQERASQSNTLGVLMVQKKQKSNHITDSFDEIFLVLVKEAEQPLFIKHYTYHDKKAAMHIITEATVAGMVTIRNKSQNF